MFSCFDKKTETYCGQFFLPRKHPTPPSKLWIREVFGVLESGLLLQEEGQVDVLCFNRVKVSQSHKHI